MSYELKPEKRDKFVGFKLTKSEHEKLESHCKEKKTTVSRFIRYVVMNKLNEK